MAPETTTIPPGLDGPLNHFVDGSLSDSSWVEYDETRYYTNAFIVKEGKILLGLKKRGFGADLYNGFGGKVDTGETSLQAAIRELQEEAGIIAPLQRIGVLFFTLDNVKWAFHIDVYTADEYTGVVTETEEMRPEWFSATLSTETQLPNIPYDTMWADDIHWLPLLLSGRRFAGRADFVTVDGKSVMNKWWFGTVDSAS